MEEPNNETRELLTQIRDLLAIVAEASRPQFRASVVARLGPKANELRGLIGSKKQWDAFLLMDGRHPQKEIADQCDIDAGNLSRLVARLKEGGFVDVAERVPSARLTRAEIEAVRDISV